MRCLFALAVLLSVSGVGAQSTLSTPFDGGTIGLGCFFDIAAAQDVTVTGFDLKLRTGSIVSVEIWATSGGGPYAPVQPMGPAAGWCLLGRTYCIGPNVAATPTPIPLAIQADIPSGTTRGFYILMSDIIGFTNAIQYSTPTSTTPAPALGVSWASDANISLLCGETSDAASGPWTICCTPRAINCNVHYVTGLSNASCPVVNPPPPYQVNQPGSSLTVDNQPDPGLCTPLSVGLALGLTATINVTSTNQGLPWDIGVTSPELTIPSSGGGFVTANGQVLNLNFLAPSFNSVFGLAFTNQFANLNLPFQAAVPTVLAGQMINFDPVQPDGFSLSHANEISFVSCAAIENFDAATVGIPGVYPACWSDGGGGRAWYVHTGSTPSGNTGPSFDHTTGSGNYLYCETSGVAVATQFILNAPQFLFSTAGTVSFAYHMFGVTTGTLELQENVLGNWTQIWSLTGDQGNMWTVQSVNLMTNPTTLRFVYTSGASFTGDTAIDDFQVN